MKRYVEFAAKHPSLLAAVVVVFFLPWVWMAVLVPPWALVTSLCLVPVAAFVALVLVVRDVSEEERPEAEERHDAEPSLKWRKRTRLFQQVLIGLDGMLERWDAAAKVNREKLQAVSDSVDDVIKLTEEAVTEISRNFRIVVAKAREQTEAATSLLRRDDDHGTGVLSLPEFIQAYDDQLVNVASHMTRFSEAADEMARHQKRVTEHARVMEQTIDELRDMASQISRIALDGSVAMTSQTLNPRDFIEMTDRIRGISAHAHELTRKTRHGLEAIGNEVREGSKRTNQVAETARRAVEVARAEIGTLKGATIEQTRKVEVTLQHINDLSVEIQSEIDHIIVAMQFQDITRQKLERLHKPALGATTDALSTLSHETRAMLQRDLYRAVRAYAESAIRPSDRDGGKAALRMDQAADSANAAGEPAPEQGAPGDKKVEIF